MKKCFDLTLNVVQHEINRLSRESNIKNQDSSSQAPFTLEELEIAERKINGMLTSIQEQLETLITGNIFDEFSFGSDFTPDWDGNNLLDSQPYVPGLPMSYTWYSEFSSFSPGKLDYIVYISLIKIINIELLFFLRKCILNVLLRHMSQLSDHASTDRVMTQIPDSYNYRKYHE